MMAGQVNDSDTGAQPQSEQDLAIEEWIRQLGPPEFVHDTVRRKFKKLGLTAVEIKTDMEAKVSRFRSI